MAVKLKKKGERKEDVSPLDFDLVAVYGAGGGWRMNENLQIAISVVLEKTCFMPDFSHELVHFALPHIENPC